MLCVGFKTGLDVAGATLRKMHATSHATGAPPRVQRVEFLLFEERVRKLPKMVRFLSSLPTCSGVTSQRTRQTQAVGKEKLQVIKLARDCAPSPGGAGQTVFRFA